MSDKSGPSDNAAFDPHQTDPARLKKEVKSDFGLAAKFLWECNDCGDEVESATRPQRCAKCGGRIFVRLN